ncbi:uncharacterized protein LOC132217662 isoform X3 [Myotis daubentonii]|uniref:uncharacterized protein LOC132217662 isoform X3 n=1 Tax=Myotis daubentonii TaxID=98922 RepID=UPI002873D75A|nr:uncharacterized protein LOC132217662 isoform X3 [Myotis daubentonii]
MSSGSAPRLSALQRHLGSLEGRGMEPVSSPLTTHVLDTASGLPAQGLCLCLSRLEDHGQQWTELRRSLMALPQRQGPAAPHLAAALSVALASTPRSALLGEAQPRLAFLHLVAL